MMTYTAHDRCDKCAAQACCRAMKGTMDILFCAHHGREYGPDLLAQGFEIEAPDEVKDLVANKVA